MPETIISKKCSTCKKIKPLSDFHKNRSEKDGHSCCCKICRIQYGKEYRKSPKGKIYHKNYQKHYRQGKKGKAVHDSSNKRYRQKEKGKVAHRRGNRKHNLNFPEQLKAQKAVTKAVRTGKLPRPDSLECHYGKHPANQYHHWHGYAPEHLLDVIPICPKCHRRFP